MEQLETNNLMQVGIYNPLLLENRKFHFRSFLLVASTNPVIAYYHDGYLRLTVDEYDPNSKEIQTYVTNIGVNLNPSSKNMTEHEIEEYTTWYYDRLQQYMLDNGQTQDPQWVENYLKLEIKKVMIHLVRMAQSAFLKKSATFEILGLDFIMDDNLQLWFIEANTMPLLHGANPGQINMMNQVVEDSLEIVIGLLRSRVKRIIQYVNKLTPELRKSARLDILGLEAKQEEFRVITQNCFEPEFEPSKTNSFSRIIDENIEGVERYSGLISERCL